MKTLSEIDTTSKRAAKGAGFSWGISEEIGKNMRLLELFGLSGIKNLNKYLKDYKKKQFQKIALISEINETKKNPFCPIILGTNFIDQVNLFNNAKYYTNKDDNKSVALGTSKINYMDPRVTVAWCKRNECPIDKVFARALRDKFPWAMSTKTDYKF